MTLQAYLVSHEDSTAQPLIIVVNEGVQVLCLDAQAAGVDVEPLGYVPDQEISPGNLPLHKYFRVQAQRPPKEAADLCG